MGILAGGCATEHVEAIAASLTLTTSSFEQTVRVNPIVLVDFSQPGALPVAALEQVIHGVRTLDMDGIRTTLTDRHADATL